MQTLNFQDSPSAQGNTFNIFDQISNDWDAKSNGLLEQLQTTLDLNKLLNIFAMEAAKHINFSNIYFKKDNISASIRGGKKGKIEKRFELKINHEFIGLLTYTVNTPINVNKFNLLKELHKYLVFPLRNAVQYKEAISLAMQDALTGLGNRRYFDEQLKRAMHHANRKHHQVGLIVADLNKFKAVNDTFGHKVGDEVLAQFSKALSACVRDSDSVFRFGGDEFVVIVEEASENALGAIENRVHLAMKNNALLAKYNMSCSLGHTFMTRVDNEASFFERADKALYQAKMSQPDSLALV